MRTTVAIDDAMLREAKRLAAASGRSLGEVVEDALRLSLARPVATRAGRRLDLPTCGVRGRVRGLTSTTRPGLFAATPGGGGGDITAVAAGSG